MSSLTTDQSALQDYIRKFLEEHFWFAFLRQKTIIFFKELGFKIDNVPTDEIIFKKNLSKYSIQVYSGFSKKNKHKAYYPMLYVNLYEGHAQVGGQGIYHPKKKSEERSFFSDIYERIQFYSDFAHNHILTRTINEALEKEDMFVFRDWIQDWASQNGFRTDVNGFEWGQEEVWYKKDIGEKHFIRIYTGLKYNNLEGLLEPDLYPVRIGVYRSYWREKRNDPTSRLEKVFDFYITDYNSLQDFLNDFLKKAKEAEIYALRMENK